MERMWIHHPYSLHRRTLWNLPEALFPYLFSGDSNSTYTPKIGAKIKCGNAYKELRTLPGP